MVLVELAVVLLVFLVAIYTLAYFQIGFTFVKEGTIVIVTRGGNFRKVLYSIKGWVYNPAIDQFVPDGTGGPHKRKGPLEDFLGIHFIGIPFFDRVYGWEFRWNKYAQPEGKTTLEIIPRFDVVKAMVFQFPYALHLSGVEVQGQIEIDFDFLITLRSISPYTALFRNENKWLEKVTGDIEAVVTRFIGSHTVDDVRTMKRGQPGILENLLALIRGLSPSLIEYAGQEVVVVEFLRYNIIGSDEVKEATKATEIARLKGEAAVEAAKLAAQAAREKAAGDADAIRALATADNERIAATSIFAAGGAGEEASEIEKSRNVKDSKITTLVGGIGGLFKK